jgi:LCP family protein required for cell wall assembly
VINYILSHPFRVVLILVLGIFLGTTSFYILQYHRTFDLVAVEAFDPIGARSAIVGDADADDEESAEERAESDEVMRVIDLEEGFGEEFEDPATDPRARFPTAFGVPIPDGAFEAYLLIGVDEGEVLADAIILVLDPTAGGRPIMVSLPRDLWVWNECRSRFTRINEGLVGCRGVATGAELMAIMVEDYTGIQVDHLARINFGGFARLVDAMGGITVCVDHPTRDFNASLDIPQAGCHDADGAMALAWVRSRNTEQLIDGEWRVTAGSDFARQRRQQDVLFQLADRAAGFNTPGALSETLGAVSASVRLNSNWTFTQAVGVGWRHRGMRPDQVTRFTVDVRDYTTSQGARVLIPRVRFTDQLRRVVSLPGI